MKFYPSPLTMWRSPAFLHEPKLSEDPDTARLSPAWWLIIVNMYFVLLISKRKLKIQIGNISNCQKTQKQPSFCQLGG